MALVKCPECGKEVSDRAKSCPNCGFPIEEEVHKNEQEYKTDSKDERVEELPPEERPEMFECLQCGRKLPVGIEECVFCGRTYRNINNNPEPEIQCPACGSYKIKQISKKPFLKKFMEVVAVGGVLPDVNNDYRTEYKCKNCGKTWE